MKRIALLLLGAGVSFSIHAQDAVHDPEISVAPATQLVLHAGTQVHLRLIDTVASNTNKRGDHFSMEVAEPVVIEGREWIPAGAPAVGEVIEATRSGMGGSPGRLILAARFVVANDSKIALRSFTAGAGADRSKTALALGASVGIPGLFVVGKNMVLPKGTDIYAKVAEDSTPQSFVDNDKKETNNEH